MDDLVVNQFMHSLTQLGAFICTSVSILIVFGGGYWVLLKGVNSFEWLLKFLDILLMFGVCIVMLTPVFTFVGFVLDVLLNTSPRLAQGGAVVGTVLGAACGRFWQARATI